MQPSCGGVGQKHDTPLTKECSEEKKGHTTHALDDDFFLPN